jgi:hypothetical protein
MERRLGEGAPGIRAKSAGFSRGSPAWNISPFTVWEGSNEGDVSAPKAGIATVASDSNKKRRPKNDFMSISLFAMVTGINFRLLDKQYLKNVQEIRRNCEKKNIACNEQKQRKQWQALNKRFKQLYGIFISPLDPV